MIRDRQPRSLKKRSMPSAAVYPPQSNPYSLSSRPSKLALGSEALWRLCDHSEHIEGSGRFAHELSAAVRDGQSAKSTEVSEIARSGRVTLFHVDDPAEKLRDELRRMLRY